MEIKGPFWVIANDGGKKLVIRQDAGDGSESPNCTMHCRDLVLRKRASTLAPGDRIMIMTVGKVDASRESNELFDFELVTAADELLRGE
ncbi:MAG: hypothetical protein HONBIEJF_02633 [Fimbriimonadaceae bacterium]|nr:hypothetical protein [Fimbriimonadaceae bacterium]